jgi:hypothetical protein
MARYELLDDHFSFLISRHDGGDKQKHTKQMKLKYKLTLTEAMLGTKPQNKEVFASFVASKAPDDDKRKEELETAEHKEEAGTTGFTRLKRSDLLARGVTSIPKDGDPNEKFVCLEDYMIRGFFKSACGALRISDDTLSKSITAYKSKIDQIIFVFPRFIPVIQLPIAADMELPPKIIRSESGVLLCERSLRAETAMGPRVTVVRSEVVLAGATFEFTITCLSKKIGKGDDAVDAEALIEEWLGYGQMSGFGQWRNASYGRFTYERMDE